MHVSPINSQLINQPTNYRNKRAIKKKSVIETSIRYNQSIKLISRFYIFSVINLINLISILFDFSVVLFNLT